MIEYEIPEQWTEIFKHVDDIGQMLREDAITKNFNPPAEYKKQLNIATGHYMFLIVEFKRWSAIKKNNESNKYMAIKNDTTTKFVSAAADREASSFVAKERYYRNILEGWMLATEQEIFTIKKHLQADTKEEKIT